MIALQSLLKKSSPALLVGTLLLSACGGGGLNLPQPAAGSYSLPLRLTQELECDGGSQLIYEISAKGEFKFMGSETPAKPVFITRQLSSADQDALDQVIEKADLAAQKLADKPVPDDAPQTLECRAVDTLTLHLKEADVSYDRNGRKFTHQQAYLDAFKAIRDKLDALKDKYAPKPSSNQKEYSYALPLKVRMDGECGLPDYARFEISTSGEFSWTREDFPTFAPGNIPTEKRQLTPAEQAQLVAKLNELNLLEQAETSEVVPADAPQTKECRTVTVYDLTADGQLKSQEGDATRKFRHSQELLDDFRSLQKELYSLSGQKLPEWLDNKS